MGWRPHDLETSFIPFVHGVGVQVGLSDPVFMARYGKQPVTNQHPEFPYDPAKLNSKLMNGDTKLQEDMSLGMNWVQEAHVYHDWEDLQFLRDTWEGPLVVKGILNAHVCFTAPNPSSKLRYVICRFLGCGKGTGLWRRWYCRIQSR